jgi:hypothetical protein
VETPTGGYHLYFGNVAELGNGRGGLPKGIDVRGGRGDGGYVLAAGSVLDRRAYAGKPHLQEMIGDGKAYTVYNDAEVLDPPGWLIEILINTTIGTGTTAPGTRTPKWWIRTEPPARLQSRLTGAVNMLAAEANGNRNELAFWAACVVGEAIAAGRVNLDDAEADLMAALEANGYRADEGDYRARSTIRSGFKTAGAL